MPTETRCIRIKLKPNSLEAVREWQRFLKDHTNEVLETLKAEGVTLEAVFLDMIGSDHYLIYIMASSDFDKAKEVAKNSQNIVDIFHKKFKLNCWDERTPLESLIDFQIL